MNSIKDLVLKEQKNSNIVINNIGGLSIINIEDFVNQPLDGMLYDLNRSEIVILTLIEEPKWINDFASTQVIKFLYNKVLSLNEDIKKLQDK